MKKRKNVAIKKALVFCEPQTVTAQTYNETTFQQQYKFFFSLSKQRCISIFVCKVVHPKKRKQTDTGNERKRDTKRQRTEVWMMRNSKQHSILTVKPCMNMRKSLAAFDIPNGVYELVYAL